MISAWWLLAALIAGFVGGCGFWHWMFYEIKEIPWRGYPYVSAPVDSKYYDG